MTNEEFADFADQMRLLVAEESYLYELPLGSRDSLGDDSWRLHGPWRRDDCAAAVNLWFDAGLVSLLRRWPTDELLASPTAREVLDAPRSWVTTPDGSTCISLVETDAGEALAWGEWTALLAVLREG
jgi:hypothetical protein